jgi:amidase
VTPYLDTLDHGVGDLRIGVVKEGFGSPESEPDVEAKVRDGAERLARLGATVEEIAVPIHGVGRAIWTPTIIEGAVDLLMRGNACGTNRPGLFVNSLSEAHSRWREHADELSVSLKLVMLVGEFVSRQYGGRFYGKSQNLIRKMREDYDRVFERYDLLLMPTTPQKATPLPAPGASAEALFEVALSGSPRRPSAWRRQRSTTPAFAFRPQASPEAPP